MSGSIVAPITDADARSLISVFGALLAAFGFFYTGVRDTVRAGIFKDPNNSAKRSESRGLVKEAFWPGMVLLAISSCLVAGLMVPPLMGVVASIDIAGYYSPSKSALAVLTVFWVLVATFWTYQGVRAAYRVMRW